MMMYKMYWGSKSDEETKENLFDEVVDNTIKMIPKTTLNPKVVHAMKNFQASYNKDANKVVEQAAGGKKILNFWLT